jgi:hypothetical protein
MSDALQNSTVVLVIRIHSYLGGRNHLFERVEEAASLLSFLKNRAKGMARHPVGGATGVDA